jgi:CCR4-NOT transcription complex subunit 6
LLDKRLIDLPSAAINRPDMKGEDDIYNRVMPKDNVAVVTFLEDRMTGSRIIVVNAHLHWDQMYKDVKVVQVAVLLEQIAQLSEKYVSWPPLKESEKKLFRYSNGDSPDGGSPGSPPDDDMPQPKPSLTYTDPLAIPLLICSDLNSLPTSGPYELISEGSLPSTHPDLESRSYGKFTREGIRHPFSLKSAYAAVGELPFTNYVSNFSGTVDYIWYSVAGLAPRALLGGVDPEYIARVPGFPNLHFPSDHVSLMAEFGFKPLRRPLGTGARKAEAWKDEAKG